MIQNCEKKHFSSSFLILNKLNKNFSENFYFSDFLGIKSKISHFKQTYLESDKCLVSFNNYGEYFKYSMIVLNWSACIIQMFYQKLRVLQQKTRNYLRLDWYVVEMFLELVLESCSQQVTISISQVVRDNRLVHP